ncbi:hypothetical protein AYI69_g3757 [Smittium culicis]|uniref:Retrotransposon gag domain-containing protein n=1 Tax=Smittium culicis TaxID=133412 RepID=A0A1R1YIX9_9FUNG|nr:hypothetical protein AYI69_g3757 [Smittium culicis]
MTFQPEVFPRKFSGSIRDHLKAEMWTKRFHMAVKFSKMDADDSLDLFKLWLNDDAAKWQNVTELEEDVSEWKLENWTKALEDKFGDKKNRNETFSCLLKWERKSMKHWKILIRDLQTIQRPLNRKFTLKSW